MKRRDVINAGLVAVLAVLAALVAGFILVHQIARFRLPWEPRPFRVEAVFTTAQALVPGQGQSVRIAGVQIGLIDSVHLEDGRAIVELDVQPRYRDRLHTDARALLRPRTPLKDMFVDLDPGTPAAPELRAGGRIPIGQTNPDINADETYDALDADGRDYLKLLVSGAGQGLDGHGLDLRRILKLFKPLSRDLAHVSGAFARQHRALARLVHNYRLIVESLGHHDADLDRFVVASEKVFSALAPEQRAISASLREMPGAFDATTTALGEVGRLGRAARPTLQALRPAMRKLDGVNRATLPLVREATPLLAGKVRPFVRAATPYTRQLVPAAQRLAQASPDLTSGFHELNRLFNMAAYNRGGAEPVSGDAARDAQRDEGYLYWLSWAAQTGVSVFSSADGDGIFRRTILMMTCDAMREVAGVKPALEPLVGFGRVLSDPTLCST